RVAGDQHQPQEIVADLLVDPGLDARRRSSGAGLDDLVLARLHLAPAELIDRAALGGGHQPGAGVVGDAGLRPALERDDQGLLREVFGEVDVADHAHEATRQPGALDPPDRLDGFAGGLAGHGALRIFAAARARRAAAPPGRAA